jgi:membrane protein YqaA with SNARE-associated domain
MRQSVTQHVATRAAAGHASRILPWIVSFGGLGLFVVAIIDASIIPLPIPGSTDLLLLVLVAQQSNAPMMAIIAIAGSLVGGYLTWKTGASGGEAAVHRYVPKRFRDLLNKWVEVHGSLAVGASALLPPPVPLMPFLLCAGALGVPRRKFLLSFAIARSIRYPLIAWLGATYGRRMVRAWSHYLADWGDTIAWILVAMLVGGILFGFWRWRQLRGKPLTTPVGSLRGRV